MSRSIDFRREQRRAAWLFLVPGILFFGVVFVYPAFRTIQMSLSEVSASTITKPNWDFVGLENFARVFALPAFSQTVTNTAVFVLASVLPQVLIGLFLAVGLRRATRWSRVGRALVLLPWLLPSVSVSAVFLWLFDSKVGLVNAILAGTGALKEPILWFAEPLPALLVIIVVNVWIGIPFNFMILQSGLQALPDDVHEAAAMDGAGWWRELTNITIPMLKDSLFAVTLLVIIGTIKVFDFVWLMTGGGPANATMLPGPLAYSQAFKTFDYGSGAAILVLTVVLLAGLAVIFLKATSSRGDGSSKSARRRRTGRRPASEERG